MKYSEGAMIPKRKILVIDDDTKWLVTIDAILSPEYELTSLADPSDAD